MTQTADARTQSRIFTLLSGVVIVAALYFARGILLPFALAVLLSFLLTPIVNRLEMLRMGRIPSVVIAVSIAFLAIGVVGYAMAIQFYDLANKLPTYQSNIKQKVQTFQSDGQGVLDRVTRLFRDVEQELTQDSPKSDSETSAEPVPAEDFTTSDFNLSTAIEKLEREGKAVPVQIPDDLTAREIAQNILGPLLAPFGTLLIVIVFVVFILIEREDLRNRFIYLVGAKQVSTTTQAIDDAASRVSRYLLMQLIVNSIYGFIIALGLFFIGLPNAYMWGFLATFLRFIPYVGPWIAAILPIVLSLAIFPGWTQPLLIMGLFACNELVSNNALEPWLYGSSTGISTIGIIISAVFWTWLWGPVGLVLATPLTVCLTVIGRHVPQFSFINKLLSDDEVLPPQLRLYQRWLAMDPEEGFEVAEEYLKSNSLASLYDSVILPTLRLAEVDKHQGNLDESKSEFIFHAAREMVEELGAKPFDKGKVDQTSKSAKFTPRVLCIPARDEADELAGTMLVQLLAAKGIEAQAMKVASLASETVERVREENAGIVCISALPPFAVTHARYIAKRLRPQFPELRIVVGLWQENLRSQKAEDRLRASGIDHFVTEVATAVDYIERFVASYQPNKDGQSSEEASI